MNADLELLAGDIKEFVVGLVNAEVAKLKPPVSENNISVLPAPLKMQEREIVVVEKNPAVPPPVIVPPATVEVNLDRIVEKMDALFNAVNGLAAALVGKPEPPKAKFIEITERDDKGMVKKMRVS